ncbi:MAG: 2-phosphosulfolactate phosphatase [Bacteroidota bacterium]|nr:2-phosphosulfolactate phosphatase [Bacteroidota bacterium]
MKIDTFLTPYFPEKEQQFNDSIVVMLDVLRASTTVCAALYNGAKEIIPSESHDKAVHIFSSLSREIRFLGGETNGLKPNGFDAGNSPLEYTPEAVKGKTVILSTTNGTKIFQKAKQAKIRLIGGFVNITSVINYIVKIYLHENNKDLNVTILCAGTNGRLSYEDTLCAGAYIHLLKQNFSESNMTDTVLVANDLYNLHSSDMKNFIKDREHAVILQAAGFGNDIEAALSYDIYPVVPIFSGSGIKKLEEII